MTSWRTAWQNALARFRDLPGLIPLPLRTLFRSHDPLKVIPYLGFGTPDRLLLTGRVLEDEGLVPAEDADTALENLLNLYHRFETDEVPGARVRARFRGVEQEAVTDFEGYFTLDIRPDSPVEAGVWHEVDLELLEPRPRTGQQVTATGRVLVPPATARFGVISDIDDTVLWSNARNKLRMALMVALLNERTRVPFKGVAAFYQALQRGAGGAENNPIFYVSSSPWNLYDLLLEFFRIHDIPTGPLFLRDIDLRKLFGSNRHPLHKMGKIEPLLQTYPHLPFVLIGDSGEKDPEIYTEVVRKYPDRIRVIYIRNVNPDPARIDAVDALVEEVRKTGCQLVLVPDSEFAAAHAAGEGLIATATLPAVRADKEQDEKSPTAPEVAGEGVPGSDEGSR